MKKMLYPNYSVLMSVYIKENPEYLRLSMESMFAQTVVTNDFVLVCDGQLTNELNGVINEMQAKHGSVLHVVRFSQNRGLGLALADGILECKNELVARMDSDDISRADRCEIQLNEFVKNSKLDICGSHILEFIDNPQNVISQRNVPLTQRGIVEYQKQRSAFNHVTVMYKKSTVLKAGNYEHCPLMEDDMLWSRMHLAKAVCCNVDDYLVYVRADAGMIERRGGYSYLRKYALAKWKIYRIGFGGLWDFIFPVCGQIVVALLPLNLRGLMFKKVLRK